MIIISYSVYINAGLFIANGILVAGIIFLAQENRKLKKEFKKNMNQLNKNTEFLLMKILELKEQIKEDH